MPKGALNNKGFGLIAILLAIVVLALVAGGGVYVYHKDHKTKVVTNSTKTSTSSTSKSSSGSTTATTNPYAGWKTYCDTTYKYCFKYPGSWKLVTELSAQQSGGTGQVGLTSADGSVTVSYINVNNHDHAISQLSTMDVETITGASQKFSIVGGYISYGSGFLPMYNLADSSLLETYSVAVGQTSSFPTTASFTDLDTDYLGSFFSQPTQQLNTVADAQAWFTTADAQTSLLILKSLYYQQR
jgi:hypothetical protein